MSVLFIGPEEEVKIQAAIECARARPMPLEVLRTIGNSDSKSRLMLAERKAGADAVREQYPAINVMLGTYRAAISFEQQPEGVARHLSVSSRAKDKVPGPEVMQMVCAAFGFSKKLCAAIGRPEATILKPNRPVMIWVEEFEPGRMAINIVEIEP